MVSTCVFSSESPAFTSIPWLSAENWSWNACCVLHISNPDYSNSQLWNHLCPSGFWKMRILPLPYIQGRVTVQHTQALSKPHVLMEVDQMYSKSMGLETKCLWLTRLQGSKRALLLVVSVIACNAHATYSPAMESSWLVLWHGSAVHTSSLCHSVVLDYLWVKSWTTAEGVAWWEPCPPRWSWAMSLSEGAQGIGISRRYFWCPQVQVTELYVASGFYHCLQGLIVILV